MTDQTIRILVIDDHPVVGEGVARVTCGSGIELLGCVASIGEAEAFAPLRPNVVLLDLRLGNLVSSSHVRELRRALPDAQVAIFTAFPDHVAIAEALSAGAVTCLVKDIGQNDLVAAVKAVARGERPTRTPGRSPDPVGLSRQERAILLHVARGQTNTEIAKQLFLAPNTVKTYWQSALAKLNAHNRAEAITHAHEVGLL